MLLALDRIRCDGGTQPRSKIDYLLVQEYQEAYKSGAKFPPIVVFYDGDEYWLADGFHRVSAIPSIGTDKINAEVKQGTREDAVWFSCGANAHHGQRRTNEDKRRSVMTALSHPKAKGLSNRAIAEHCGVSHPFVDTVQGELETVTSCERPEQRKGKDGKRRGERKDSKKKQQREKRRKQTEKATRAAAQKRAMERSESALEDENAHEEEIETEGGEPVSYDDIVALALRLSRVQQESLVRVLQRRWSEAA